MMSKVRQIAALSVEFGILQHAMFLMIQITMIATVQMNLMFQAKTPMPMDIMEVPVQLHQEERKETQKPLLNSDLKDRPLIP